MRKRGIKLDIRRSKENEWTLDFSTFLSFEWPVWFDFFFAFQSLKDCDSNDIQISHAGTVQYGVVFVLKRPIVFNEQTLLHIWPWQFSCNSLNSEISLHPIGRKVPGNAVPIFSLYFKLYIQKSSLFKEEWLFFRCLDRCQT